jgi:hypothetical protein
MTSEHIENSISKALKGESNLTQEILNIRGFSTATIRRLFNCLCDTAEPITYLEVGLFAGASFCSSFNKNCTSIGIEDHSQDFSAGFDQVKKELKENIDKFSDKAKEVHVHYVDCFKMDKSVLPKIDIYSYDGHHDEIFQEKALPSFIDVMADRFIFLIDDWSWPTAKNGTLKSLDKLKDKIEIEKEWTLGEGLHNHPVWHNGLKIYLINKK